MTTSTRPRRLALTGALLATTLVGVGAASASTPPSATEVVSVPVSFTVKNTNTTSVACTSDGKTYTIRGHVTGTKKQLASKSTATTLYLHAVTQGEFYWKFQGVPGYDFSKQEAQRGHLSVTIDRLGYGSSDKPPGLSTCFGSQADTAHQVVQQLKAGTYAVGKAAAGTFRARAFPTTFLAGHSAGALIGTIETYTYHDVAGFINFGWSDTTTSAFLTQELSDTESRCLKSALGSGTPGNPRNYEAFGPDGEKILFASASKEVRKAVPAANPDPCGDLLSIPAALSANSPGVSTYTGPVLIIAGGADSLFPAPDVQVQAARYTSSPSVTYKLLPATGHGFNYEASHLQSMSLVDTWLTARHG